MQESIVVAIVELSFLWPRTSKNFWTFSSATIATLSVFRMKIEVSSTSSMCSLSRSSLHHFGQVERYLSKNCLPNQNLGLYTLLVPIAVYIY